jgi:hypothetical protein
MYLPFSGDGGAGAYEWRWCEPDGIYRVYRRPIPVANDSGHSVNDGKPVVSVHNLSDLGIGLLGRERSVDVKE